MNRRFAVSSLLAGSLTAITGSAAFGAAEWCEDDPLVVIKTPTGQTLPLHVTNYAEGTQNQKYLALVPDNQEITNAWIGWTVVRSKRGGRKPSTASAAAIQWDVVISVTIHATDLAKSQPFRTRTVASSEEFARGTLYAEARGTANRAMELRFSIWA